MADVINIHAGSDKERRTSGGGGDMEARIAKLEADVSYIKEHIRDVKSESKELRSDIKELRRDTDRDFRILFGAIITVALGLAGLMAKGFHWL